MCEAPTKRDAPYRIDPSMTPRSVLLSLIEASNKTVDPDCSLASSPPCLFRHSVRRSPCGLEAPTPRSFFTHD
jgi:hypothetical protein